MCGEPGQHVAVAAVCRSSAVRIPPATERLIRHLIVGTKRGQQDVEPRFAGALGLVLLCGGTVGGMSPPGSGQPTTWDGAISTRLGMHLLSGYADVNISTISAGICCHGDSSPGKMMTSTYPGHGLDMRLGHGGFLTGTTWGRFLGA